MGEVTRYRKRHWTGLDVDLASIPNPELGDSYLATDKNKLYYKTTSGWKTGLGYEYVPLSKAVPDWTEADLTLDGAWKVDGLDCGAKGVPAGAVGVIIHSEMIDASANQTFQVRQNATSVRSLFQSITQVSNVYIANIGTIPIDSNLLMDYAGPAGLDSLDLTIIGYFI